MLLAEKSAFLLETNFANTTKKGALSYSGKSFADGEEKSSGLSQVISYGVNKRFSIGLQLNYLIADDTSWSYGSASMIAGTKNTYKSSGIVDPSLGFKYRVCDMERCKGLLDVVLKVSPKLMSAKSAAANGPKGNGGKGGTDLNLGIDFGQKYSALQWKLLARVGHEMKRTTKELSDNSVSKIDSRTNYDFGLRFLYSAHFRS